MTSASTARSASSTARAPARPRPRWPIRCLPMSGNGDLRALQALVDAQYRAQSAAMVGTRQRVLVTGRAVRARANCRAAPDNNRVVNFAGDAAARPPLCRRRHHRRAGALAARYVRRCRTAGTADRRARSERYAFRRVPNEIHPSGPQATPAGHRRRPRHVRLCDAARG